MTVYLLAVASVPSRGNDNPPLEFRPDGTIPATSVPSKQNGSRVATFRAPSKTKRRPG